MKIIKPYLVSAFLFISLFAQDSVGQIEGLDPNNLNDSGPEWPVIINPGLQFNVKKDQEKQKEVEIQVINGFRVQVLATRFAEKADSLMFALSDQIDEQTYVTFEAPNYKVRVGDCTDRKEAEELQKKMQKLGFPAAWIIRERIEWQQ